MPREIFQIYPVGQPLPGEPGFIGPLLPDEYGGKDTEDDSQVSAQSSLSREEYEKFYNKNPNMRRIPYENLKSREDLEKVLDTFFNGDPATICSISGISMEPTLKTGDLAVIENPKTYGGGRNEVFQQISEGDMVMTLTHETDYQGRYTGHVVPQLHRVDRVNRDETGRATALFTKGDNNSRRDRFPVLPTTSPSTVDRPAQYLIGKVYSTTSMGGP